MARRIKSSSYALICLHDASTILVLVRFPIATEFARIPRILRMHLVHRKLNYFDMCCYEVELE